MFSLRPQGRMLCKKNIFLSKYKNAISTNIQRNCDKNANAQFWPKHKNQKIQQNNKAHTNHIQHIQQ